METLRVQPHTKAFVGELISEAVAIFIIIATKFIVWEAAPILARNDIRLLSNATVSYEWSIYLRSFNVALY